MRETLARTMLHLLNWVAAFFPLAILALSCAVLIAALSLVSEEAE